MEKLLDAETTSERELFENRRTEKRIARDRKQHLLARVALIGILWIVGEGLIVYVGIQIQKIGAFVAAYETGWNHGHVEYGFNHLYYTLGLLFFIVMNLALYYGAFDKIIKKYIYQSGGYAVFVGIAGVVSAAVTYIISNLLLIGYNEYMSRMGSYKYGPESMFYLTHIGWPIFVILFITAQVIKNVIITRSEKKLK